jgi:two-component system CheB/CheR fusion protein
MNSRALKKTQPCKTANEVRIFPATGRQVKYRVLLVDDHVPLAEATAEFMRSAELEVRISSWGRDALSVAGVFKPDIVICDLNLPDMSGLDVARAMRGIPALKGALIAMHTAIPENELRQLERHLDEPSVNLFLSKPLTDEKLDTLISAVQALRRPIPRRDK